jgi:Asp-tRNA(Asn)/Glu-tRNA(Gln) amidotransferase A subunit family amidase
LAFNLHLQCSIVFTYTFLFNMLDYPAGVVPWTRVTDNDVRACAAARTEHMSPAHVRVFEHNARPIAVGLPIGVQVAAPTYCEEMCLHVMHELDG